MSIELAYSDSGSGPAVVLIHAFPLDRSMWDAQVPALAAQYRVIAVDLRGFGGSPLGDDAPHLDAMADDVAALLDRLEITKCVVAGLSLGGYVSMALLRRHARLFAGLMLIDTKGTADGDAAANNRERIAATVEDDGNVDVLISDVLPALTGETTKLDRPQVVALIADIVRRADPASVAWVQRAMAARPDSVDTLEDFEEPALVVVGDEDVLAPVAEAQMMLDALPDATLAVIPGCGHLSAMERPDDLTAIMLDYLDELAAAGSFDGAQSSLMRMNPKADVDD